MISKFIVAKLYENRILTIEDKYFDACVYCIDYFLSHLMLCFFCIVVGILSSNTICSIIYSAILIPLRAFCGGAHASTKTKCNILSYGLSAIIIPNAPQLIATTTPIIITNAFILFLIPIILLSPMENKNKPLSPSLYHKSRKKTYTFLILITILYISMYLLRLKLYFGMIALCVIICSVSVLVGFYQNLKGTQNEV